LTAYPAPVISVVVIVVCAALVAAGIGASRLLSAQPAADDTANPNCTLIVPANPLTAQGLATPYQLTATNPADGPCNEANTNQTAFVQAAVVNPATGQISVYDPLVVDAGTQPAAAPVVPALPAGGVVGIWFGFNGGTLSLAGADQNLNTGNNQATDPANSAAPSASATASASGTPSATVTPSASATATSPATDPAAAVTPSDSASATSGAPADPGSAAPDPSATATQGAGTPATGTPDTGTPANGATAPSSPADAHQQAEAPNGGAPAAAAATQTAAKASVESAGSALLSSGHHHAPPSRSGAPHHPGQPSASSSAAPAGTPTTSGATGQGNTGQGNTGQGNVPDGPAAEGTPDAILQQADCVAGQEIGGKFSSFTQVGACNAAAFFTAANQAITAGKLKVPAPGTATDGQACLTTRSFALIDQDQSDNVTTEYLTTGNGQIAQDTAANRGTLTGASTLVNGSDNGLLDLFVDPALGCHPWEEPNLGDAGAPAPALPLDELQAAAWAGKDNSGPAALVPLNDPMTEDSNGNFTAAKTNTYRSLVDMPALPAGQSPATYCSDMEQIQGTRLQQDVNLLINGPSPTPAEADNLFTFLAMRLQQSFMNLNCGQFGQDNDVSTTTDGNNVVVAACFVHQVAATTPGPGNPTKGQRTCPATTGGQQGQHGGQGTGQGHGQGNGQPSASPAPSGMTRHQLQNYYRHHHHG
ncbi:MAG TPA: hypothetical protein VHF26_10755, partial [Trebonia sp.]|nr:hypothetical protein [Trebonia sp.]